MTASLALWVLGLAASVIGTLSLLLMNRITTALDKTAAALGQQGMLLSAINATINGDNGVLREVSTLRNRYHDQGNSIHLVQGETAVLEIRVTKLEEAEERRSDAERRSGYDRRQS